MPRKVFVAGEILTAADVNTNLMDQAVMSFAGTAARGSAIPSPVEGMVAYIADQDLVQVYDGSAWKNSLKTTGGILQVVSTPKLDFFSTGSTTLTDITGLSVSITPSSATSKILVLGDVVSSATDGTVRIQLVRNSTEIYKGTDGTIINGTKATPIFGFSTLNIGPNGIVFLDSPATTSAITYKFQMACSGAGQTGFVNRTAAANTVGFTSSITVLEVAA